MVRSVACFTFVGACLSATLHSDINLESVMQDHGAALEKTYRQMLQDVINNPTDQTYKPNKNYMESAREHFGFLKNDLEQQKGENQELITHANSQVAKCNDNATQWFNAPDTGINVLLAKVTSARTVHTDCRTEEIQKIMNYDASKTAFDTQNSAGCTKEQDWWSSTDGGEGTFVALYEAGRVARDDKAAKQTQEAQCDRDQYAFEEAFCKYGALLDGTCSHYDTCHTAKLESRTDIETTVRELETSQKLVWKMVQKIECYIGKIEQASTRTPTEADLTECISLIPEAGALNVTYTPAAPRIPCDVTPAANKPGSEAWMSQEYTGSTLVFAAEKSCSVS